MFKLISNYQPTGDQPQAIEKLVKGLKQNKKFQILLGVTGSGKTFTIANVIAQINMPTLIISHNKTLAAQLYGEFKTFFPENRVEYFVSYYDYYQPEAYLPVVDKYIEKDASINNEIENLRLSATSALLSGRNDVIIVASVSCIYGMGNPKDFYNNTVKVHTGQKIKQDELLYSLVDSLYSRNEADFQRGTFRVRGDTVDVFIANSDVAYKIIFWDDIIDEIICFNPYTGKSIEKLKQAYIFPANIFIPTKQKIENAIQKIEYDLIKQVDYFKEQGKDIEAKRLYERVRYDLEMIKEIGYCNGIENYSRYFDGRAPGERPFCLLDYFPDKFLTIIDESHVTIPQLHSMYSGDHSRKKTLVEYGFRLAAALDNRPLMFSEFEQLIEQTIFVSATPAEYEIKKSNNTIIEQIIRPTGLIDPEIQIKPTFNQIDNLIEEINNRSQQNQRVIVTTLTKRMAEELSKYLRKLNIKSRYIHSEIDTLERVEILEDFRKGVFDVLVGVNLLREGLDLPEVSLVAIMDADKEGFLRSERSLTQIAGRAARNINGKVIMYADNITHSIQKTIDETNRRRLKQIEYNKKHNISPQQIIKPTDTMLNNISGKIKESKYKPYIEQDKVSIAADPVIKYMSKNQIISLIEKNQKEMQKAAKELNFIHAARLRDEIKELKKLLYT